MLRKAEPNLFACLCRLLFAFGFGLSAVCAGAQSLEEYLGKPVAEVRVVVDGSQKQPGTEDLKSLLRVREGKPYSAVEARRSLIALYESGRVSNASVSAQPVGAGAVVITFHVTPQPRVGEVTFTGLVAVTEEEMRAKLGELDRGLKFSEGDLRRGAERIYETLKERGYYQAAIEPKLKYDPLGTSVDINFNVNAGKAATVAAVNLPGQSKIAEATLRTVIKTKIGAVFSQAQLNADVQQLLAQHLAQRYLAAQIGPPDITYNDAANTVAISLPIKSGPQFSVRVEGASLTENKLRQLLPLMREGGLDAATLDDSARRISDYLQEEGYFFNEVEAPPMPDLNAERAELVFTVTPNQRYRVTEIRITGTEHVKLEDVAPDLRTQTAAYVPLPFFAPRYVRGLTSEQALRHDADVILTNLRDQGYRRAKMQSINRAVSEANDSLKIIFNVEEGERSTVGDIAFRGNALYTEEELRERIDLKRGAPYSPSQVKTEANKLLQCYADAGYASATVTARAAEMSDEHVRVIYEISEGPLVYINRIFINTLGTRQRTVGGRVRNYLRFAEGDRLRNNDLARSEQDLYAVGAFRRAQIRSESLGEEGTTGEAQRNVYVDVEEGKSRVLVYGAGYQSDEGVRGIFEVSDPNAFGRLTTMSLRLRASPRNLLGQLAYTDPRPFNRNTPLLFSLLVQKQHRPAFDSQRGTVLLQVEKQLRERSLLLFRYNYEDVRVSDPDGVTDRRDKPVRLSRVSASYAFDGRDNPFDPQKGRYHTADISVAIRRLGGNEQFARLFTENQFYYHVPSALPGGKGTVLAANFRIGLSQNIGERRNLSPTATPLERRLLPLTERFFTGGSTTLRGYGFEEAGPRDFQTVTTTRTVNGQPQTTTTYLSRPLGGNALIVFNAEIRRAIYRQISLVSFYDGGNVFGRVSDINFKNFSHTVGAGLRFKTPLGPFRLDLGYLANNEFAGTGLTPVQQSLVKIPRLRIHLSFGQAF